MNSLREGAILPAIRQWEGQMRGSTLTLFLAAASLVFTPLAATANDSMAELKTGGLSFVRTDAISMLREDLSISMNRIDVDYVFENRTDSDVESLIAFPMPDIVPVPYEYSATPNEDDNFLGFRVFVEGKPVTPELTQRALAFGVDITEDLRGMNVPLMPYSQGAVKAVEGLPQELLADWVTRGIVYNDVYDVGKGMVAHPTPLWTLQQVYTWRMRFPAGQQVRVSHTYTPSVGGSAGVVFLDHEGKKSEMYRDYVDRYCIDPPFVNAVAKRVKPEGGIPMTENWISYILTTGQNWYGTIGTFHLTIDKGSTSNLVSFCGTGVKKTGPTTFELTYKDYYPERELDVLFMEPANW